ncbi:uncharacterized protein [Palaemon carinicauda]|uniref:uncharacterized protein n=1 Tax=Palaemon carinicauda TaxID=392227 RepID=UPI0035B5E254
MSKLSYEATRLEVICKILLFYENCFGFCAKPLEIPIKVCSTGSGLKQVPSARSYPREVCKAVIVVYKDEVLRCPKTEEDWKEVAARFSSRWNYHNCLGAVDEKHIGIKKPHNAGSYYYNYKGFHSIVLMAVADATFKFLYVDVGAEGGYTEK